jgi:hypothetical protein
MLVKDLKFFSLSNFAGIFSEQKAQKQVGFVRYVL